MVTGGVIYDIIITIPNETIIIATIIIVIIIVLIVMIILVATWWLRPASPPVRPNPPLAMQVLYAPLSP